MSIPRANEIGGMSEPREGDGTSAVGKTGSRKGGSVAGPDTEKNSRQARVQMTTGRPRRNVSVSKARILGDVIVITGASAGGMPPTFLQQSRWAGAESDLESRHRSV
jgi:hypothetical protein